MCLMNHETINYEISDRIARITFSRPERRNPIDDLMIKEFTEALISAGRNPAVRAVMITGSGAAFCAGMDLNYLKASSDKGHDDNLEDARCLMKMLQTLHSIKKPTVAAVNGPALGGGCGIAAACDFVFAGKRDGRLGIPEVRIGFLPALILVYLIKRMGEGRAKEMVLRGDIYDAQTAASVGLVTEVFDDEILIERSMEFITKLAENSSPSAMNLSKELFVRYHEMVEKDLMEYAANLNALVRKTDDFRRGLDSFFSKDKLKW